MGMLGLGGPPCPYPRGSWLQLVQNQNQSPHQTVSPDPQHMLLSALATPRRVLPRSPIRGNPLKGCSPLIDMPPQSYSKGSPPPGQ